MTIEHGLQQAKEYLHSALLPEGVLRSMITDAVGYFPRVCCLNLASFCLINVIFNGNIFKGRVIFHFRNRFRFKNLNLFMLRFLSSMMTGQILSREIDFS